MDADLSHDPATLPGAARRGRARAPTSRSARATCPAGRCPAGRAPPAAVAVGQPLRRAHARHRRARRHRRLPRLPGRRSLEKIDLDRVHADGYGFQIEMAYAVAPGGRHDRRGADHVPRPRRGHVEDVARTSSARPCGWSPGGASGTGSLRRRRGRPRPTARRPAVGRNLWDRARPATTADSSGTRRGPGRDRETSTVFRGIPYAAPPVGDRAASPRRPARAVGRRATRRTPARRAAEPARRSSRCSAATATPAARTACTSTCGRRLRRRGRPVMVWIHGGAFVFGSGSTSRGTTAPASRRTATSWSSRSTTGSARSASCTSTTSRRGFDGLGQRRAARPGRRARVGARQHRGVRRRPRQRHGLRRVGRRDERRHAARHAGRARAVPPGDPAERRGRRTSTTPDRADRGRAEVPRRGRASGRRRRPLRRCRRPTCSRPSSAGRRRRRSTTACRSSRSSTAPCCPSRRSTRIGAGHAAGVDLLIGTTLDEMKLFLLMDPTLGSLDEAAVCGRGRRVASCRRAAAGRGARASTAGDRRRRAAGDLWSRRR